MSRGEAQQSKTARAGRHSLEYSILLTATLCLLAAGAVMVYSASSPQSLLAHGDGSGYLIKFAGYGAVGLVVMRYLARGGLDRLRAVTPALLAISFALLVAVKLPHIGRTVNGARRWIGAGPLQFQPSELMKIALVLYCAHVLTAKRKLTLRPLILVTGAACALVAIQPDLGTALVLGFTLFCVLLAAGVPLSTLGKLLAGCAALIVLFALLAPYRRARLTAFLNPWAHAGTTGFQAVQGQIALGSGGLFGVGPGQSVQKVFYLPEAHTDFILAVIGEELGAIGVCLLLSLYGLIAYAGLRAAQRAKGAYAALVAVGVTSLILSQALLNAFAVLGLAPLTGVPLPFISYGSSNLIVMLAGMGLLLNVAGGGAANVRAVGTPAGKAQRWADAAATAAQTNRDRSGRYRGTRRAGAGGGRRAAR